MKKLIVQALDVMGGAFYSVGTNLMYLSDRLDHRWKTDVWQEVESDA